MISGEKHEAEYINKRTCIESITFYYMVAQRAGKMNQTLPCDWLPERARWSYRPLGITHSVPQEKFPRSHIINPLLTKLVRSRWLDIGLVLFSRVYGPRLRLCS